MKKIRKVGGVLLLLAALVMFVIPVAADQPPDLQCPDGGTKYDSGSGSVTIDGVTIAWGGTQVTVSGGSVEICVKAATTNSGIFTINDGETWTVDWVNNGGQVPDISHIVVYSTTPPPPPPACTNVGEWVLINTGDWVVSEDSLSRTRTLTYEKYDLDNPGGVCDTKTETETELLYCLGNGQTDWYAEGTAPEGATLGFCPTPPPGNVIICYHDQTLTVPEDTLDQYPGYGLGSCPPIEEPTPVPPPVTAGEGSPAQSVPTQSVPTAFLILIFKDLIGAVLGIVGGILLIKK